MHNDHILYPKTISITKQKIQDKMVERTPWRDEAIRGNSLFLFLQQAEVDDPDVCSSGVRSQQEVNLTFNLSTLGLISGLLQGDGSLKTLRITYAHG